MGEKRCGMTKQNEKISLFERGRGERGGRGGGEEEEEEEEAGFMVLWHL